MKISVIIPTHNRPDKLVETVAALRQQTLPATDYEILVMDDGSTPPVVLTGEMENPTCRVLRLDGVERSAARNAGAAAAQGRILLFLDDDIGVKADFLAAHVRAHEEWPGALVVGAIHLPPEILKTPFGRFRQKLELHGLPQERGVVAIRNFCTAANMSLDRNLYFELGGFNSAIRSSEDQDLALRHTARSGKIVFIPEADTVHYDHSLDIQSYCRRVEWGSEKVVTFCQSWTDWHQNIERQRINGSLQFGREPLGLSLRKIAKSVLGRSLLLNSLFRLTVLLERMMPQSMALDRLYRLLLGIHLQRGYRKGLESSATELNCSIHVNENQSKVSIKPNLFIVGAPKCGTTSMSDYLGQHPDIFMSANKEPHFFGSDLRYNPGYIRDKEEYLALFTNARHEKIIGEASTWYLFSSQAAREIRDFSPDAHIIIMLRNPVEMIYSLHAQRLYDCNEDIPDFVGALAAEAERSQGLRRPKAFHGSLDVYLYREVGKYAQQVQRYLDIFGRERVHFILFDDLMKDTAAVFKQTCNFLGIDSTMRVNLSLKNQMKKHRLLSLGRFMRIPPTLARMIFRVITPQSLRRKLYDFIWNLNVKIEKRELMKPELADSLSTEFAPDVERLSNLLGRDLNHWIVRRRA